MRYKGCHQAHNAKVVICALFTTRNSLKLQGRRKVFSPIRKSSCHIAKVVLAFSHDSRQIPIASDARPLHTSRGFLHWRFAYAGPTVRAAPPSWGRHPQTFTIAEVSWPWSRRGVARNKTKAAQFRLTPDLPCSVRQPEFSEAFCHTVQDGGGKDHCLFEF